MFSIALTVETPSGIRRDVVARASAGQTAADLATRLAHYLGLPTEGGPGGQMVYSVLVQRTGERLDATTPLAEADLLEGDVVALVPAPTTPAVAIVAAPRGE
jgi:hypothetical protein